MAEKLAEIAPAAIVTLAGTVTAGLSLLTVTMAPLGAGLLRLTVPVDEAPPVTCVGLIDNEDKTAARFPPYTA